MQKRNWIKILLFSLLAVILINIAHAFFLYQNKYNPITIEYTAAANFNTFNWLTVTPKYSSETYNTKTIPISSGASKKISTTINESKGIQFLGLYWSSSIEGVFKIEDISISSNNKTWDISDLDKFVAYASNNVVPVITSESITATSNKAANGWLMIDVQAFEKIARNKQFKPLSWLTCTILFLLFVICGAKYYEIIIRGLNTFKVEGSILYQSRIYLLYLWMILLPFWNIISHVLMAVSVALAIAHFIVAREKFETKHFIKFIPLTMLFVAIALVNLVAYPDVFLNEAGDYMYFLLTPFVFIGIALKELGKIFNSFKWAVFTYVVLLILAIIERYVLLQTAYSFTDFFFETLELYWHSSYLSAIILIPLLFQYIQKKPSFKLIVITLIAFLFMYISQARLPLILGLIILIGLTILKFPKKIRRIYTAICILLLLVGALWITQSAAAQKRITETFLTNQTQKTDARSELWKHSFMVARDNLAVGIGRENIRETLSNKIEQSSAIKYRRYNSHNQYLEFLLGYGVVILIVFLAVLITPVVVRYRYATIFTLYMALAMLVESYLSRQAGVVLFSLWYSFFIWYDSKNNK
ncbi:O-antigen ligase family protein [Rasiella rasia]|uniref:O-antigen ligase family protein n=1 Tax=Rasiella rasia TaxID=2744027 RepID=A0A6G6GN27_9FLAO|nr:O-antigen ligase family protein [Rasiella rasia]QIE59927.1 O-antigen ligase family protein [Rasiella rasia]